MISKKTVKKFENSTRESMMEAEKQKYGVEDYIGFAESLKDRCRQMANVQGIGKLEREIHAELKFLHSLKRHHQEASPSHLHSSNLCHFASIVHATERLPDVVSVLQPFRSPDRGQGSLVVDVVACQGYHWVKVIARKGQALHLIWAGQGQFGERDLVAQAKDYLKASNHNQHHFQSPKVHMVFYNQVTIPMAEALTSLGITVWGQRVKVHDDVTQKLTSVLTLDDTFDDDEDFSDNDDNAKEESSGGGCEEDNNNYFDDNSLRRLRGTVPQENILCNSNDSSKTPNTSRVLDISSDTPNSQSNLPDQVFHCDKSSSNKRNTELYPPFNNDGMESFTQSKETQSSETLTKARLKSNFGSDGSSSPNPSTDCYETTTKQAQTEHPHESLFSHIVISPPDYENFPSSPSDNLDTHSLSTKNNTPLSSPSSSSSTSRQDQITTVPRRVNLDITSLITLVSNVTHGHCHLVFKEKVLATQAMEERQSPCLPSLEAYLQGKELYACQTAVDSFQTILDVLGGSHEKERAVHLLSSVTVVPDQPSPRANRLETQGKIKQRSKIVFGTGDSMKAVTVTSNTGFVRAARHQGVEFSVFTHPARALTEEKEPSATPL